MQPSWSLPLLVVSLMLTHALPKPNTLELAGSTVKPKLIVSSDQEREAMLYQFIIEHRPTSLGQNYYLKPGQLVGTFSLDSGTLNVRHENSKRPISNKLNILFVATPKEHEDAATNNTLSE